MEKLYEVRTIIDELILAGSKDEAINIFKTNYNTTVLSSHKTVITQELDEYDSLIYTYNDDYELFNPTKELKTVGDFLNRNNK